MDTMLIWWTVFLIGINFKLGLSVSEDSFLKHDANDSASLKSKRQLDFNFDASVFDGAGLFEDKNEDFKTLADDEDFSAFLPQGPKVVRSSEVIYGIKTPKSAEISAEVSGQKPKPSNVNLFSDEAPESVNPSTPYYNDFLGQPLLNKPNPYAAGNAYKIPKKPIGTYPAYPGLPIYNSFAAKSTNNQQILPQNSPYKTPSLPNLKKITYPHKVYAPLNNRYSQQSVLPSYGASFQSFAQPSTTSDFPIYYRGAESAPVLYSSETGLPYKNDQPSYGGIYSYKPKKSNLNARSGMDAPFFSQESSGLFAHFPVFSHSPRSKFPVRPAFSNDYQEFKLQPQLHFNQNRNKDPKSFKSLLHGNPYERIRSDVEIIDKKKPPPHGKEEEPKDIDNDRDGAEEDTSTDDLSQEGPRDTKYSSYFPKAEEEGEEDTHNYEEPEPETGFKPSSEYPFKEYDAKFGSPRNARYKNPKSEDEDPKIDLAAKFRYQDDLKNVKKDDEPETESSETNHYANSKAESDDEYQENYYRNGGGEDDEEKLPINEKTTNIHKGRDEEYKRNYKKDKIKSRLPAAATNPHYRQEKPSKLLKKSGNRAYRDKTGERSPTLNWSFPSKYDQKFDSSQMFSKEKSLPSVWEDTFEVKSHIKDDDMSMYSKEEAAGKRGKKNRTPDSDEYTTRASYKTSTVPAKDAFKSFGRGKSGFLSSNFLDSWNSGSSMNMNFGNSFSKPKKKSTFGSSDFFNQDFDRKEVFTSLRGI